MASLQPMSLTSDLPDFQLASEMVLVPGIEGIGLNEDEQRIARWLSARLFSRREILMPSNQYYIGEQQTTNLGISLPPELQMLRSILGWAQSGIDALDERLEVQGFRMPGSTHTDDDMWQIWQANNLDAEHSLAHLDAMIYGVSYAVVGTGEDGEPIITIESPMDLIANYDTRARRTTCAYQTYIDIDPTSDTYQQQKAAVYLPNATVHLVNQNLKGWAVVDRDDHNLGKVPVVPFINRMRSGVRTGESEITAAWRNCIDRACRTAVQIEVTREFYGAPKLFVLGATEQAFQNSDGSPKSAWDTYIGRVSALEADENGNLPQVQRFPGENPANLVGLLDHETRIMAGLTGLPPNYLGIFSEGNPASADAIRLSDFRLSRRADKKTVMFSDSWETVMRLALEIRDGEVPDGAEQLETDWAPTAIPTPAADTDAISKQISTGMLPSDSDVALAKVGYTAVERDRIEQERQAEVGQSTLDALIATAGQHAVRVTAQDNINGQPTPGQQEPGNDNTNAVDPIHGGNGSRNNNGGING